MDDANKHAGIVLAYLSTTSDVYTRQTCMKSYSSLYKTVDWPMDKEQYPEFVAGLRKARTDYEKLPAKGKKEMKEIMDFVHLFIKMATDRYGSIANEDQNKDSSKIVSNVPNAGSTHKADPKSGEPIVKRARPSDESNKNTEN